MQTFDNTRPPVAAMAIGVGRAALDLTREILGREGFELSLDKNPVNSSALSAELCKLEAEWKGRRMNATNADSF